METPLPWGSPPEGQSRAAPTRHVLARFRSSTHPYARTRCPMSHSRVSGEAEPKPLPSGVRTIGITINPVSTFRGELHLVRIFSFGDGVL